MKIELEVEKLANLLVEHGIIEAAAIDDSEGYDAGSTSRRVAAVCREINDLLSYEPQGV